MSKLHGNLQDAVASIMDRRKLKEEQKKLTFDDLMSLKRHLVEIFPEGFADRYFMYVPLSVTESAVFQRNLRKTENDESAFDPAGVVDLMIACIKDQDGRPRFTVQQRTALLDKPNDIIGRFWTAMAKAKAPESFGQAEAEKK